MKSHDLAERQRIEIQHWNLSPTEGPDSDLLTNFLKKSGDASILLDLVGRYRSIFENARTVVEVGAGVGWAACIVKRLFPEARVVATDISKDAIASVWKWEYLCQTKLDSAYPALSYQLAEAGNSVDLVFCFASAHHFGAHRRTLREIARVLKSGGTCLYLYEPSCPRYLHSLAYRRVNRIRPSVPEDVLVYNKIASLGNEVGLQCRRDFYPNVLNRRPAPLLYYTLLARARFLCRLLPCTANYEFAKS